MKNFTMIIPTFNRPHYLNRILDYYENKKVKFEIIIADSSIEKNKEKNKEIIESFKNIDISHQKYKQDIFPYEKLLCALKSVNKEYCFFCADDDFINPEEIRKCAIYLEENKDYSCAHGNYVEFRLKKNKTFVWQQMYENKKMEIINEKAIDRLSIQMKNYISTLYALHRTEKLKESFQEGCKVKDMWFAEWLTCKVHAIQGKIKQIDGIYGIREMNQNSTGANHRVRPDFINDKKAHENYEKYKKILIENTLKKGKVSEKEIEKRIDDAWQFFLDKQVINIPKKRKANNYLTKLKLPTFIDESIRITYNQIMRLQGKNYWRKKIPASSYYNEFKIIKEHILKHKEECV